MKLMFYILTLFLLLIGTAYAEISAGDRIVHGLVKDAQNNECLPNATIMVKGTSIGTKTNAEGVFVLHVPVEETVTLEARFIGYATLEVVVKNNQADVVFKMKQTEIRSGEVEIIGDRMAALKAEKEISLTTISPKLLETLPKIGQADIFRSLQLLPGIGGTNDRSSGLYVRGGTPDQNLILFDGMTVYHVDHLFGFFSAFNPDAVKDVQLYKGGFPAMYGGRLSSVVEMTGKTGDPDHYHVSLGANFLSANAMVEVPLFNKGAILVAGRRSFADIIGSETYTSLYKFLTGEDLSPSGAQGIPGGGPGPRGGGFQGVSQQELPRSYFDDLNAKVTYAVSSTDNFSASFYRSSDAVDKSTESASASIPGMGSPFMTSGSTDKTTQGNLGFSGKWFHQWSPSFFSNIFAAAATYKSSYEFGIARRAGNEPGQTSGQNTSFENNTVGDRSLRWDNEWYYDQDNELRFGVQLTSMSTVYSLDQNLPFSAEVSPVLDVDEHALQSSLYMQNKWKGIAPLEINYGLRATYYDVTKQYFVEPRLSLRYPLTETFSLKGAYGNYHQFVNRIINDNLTEGSRDFWLVANNAMTPGRANHYIAGATWETEGYVIDVEAYYKTMTNLVEFSQRIRRGPEDRYDFFTGRGTSKGVELLLQKKSGTFTGWIAYTLSSARNIFPELNGGLEFASSEDQRHEVKCVGELALGGGWSVSSTFIFGSGKPYTSPVSQYVITLLDSTSNTYTHVSDKNAYRLPYYQRLDLCCSYRFGEQDLPWTVGFTAFNLLNRNNVSYYKYDLSTQPMTVTSVTGLGFTPTLFAQITLR